MYDSGLKTYFLCHDMKTRIKQKKLQKFMWSCQNKKSKSISNLLIKTNCNDSYNLIQFDSYMREADTKQNKNVLTTESTATQHTILQEHWL